MVLPASLGTFLSWTLDQELLVELAVFAEVLPEIQKDALAVLFDEDLVLADSLCSVVDGDGYHLTPSYPSTLDGPLCAGNRYKLLWHS